MKRLVFVFFLLLPNSATAGEFGSLVWGMSYDTVVSILGEGECKYIFSINCHTYHYDNYETNGVRTRLTVGYSAEHGIFSKSKLNFLGYSYGYNPKVKYNRNDGELICAAFKKMFYRRFPNSRPNTSKDSFFDMESDNTTKYQVHCHWMTGHISYGATSKYF